MERSKFSTDSESLKGRVLYELDIRDNNDKIKILPVVKTKKATLYMLFQKKDIPLQVLAICATALASLTPAISAILMGRVFDVLSNLTTGEYATVGDFMHKITLATMALLGLAAGTIPVTWLTISCWMSIGERHGLKARNLMLTSYLTKSIEWYESNEQVFGELTQLNRCVEELRAGNSEATALTLQNGISIIALLGTSFYYSWSVTLIMLASSPLILILSYVFAKLIENFTALENSETLKAAKIFDWSLSSAKIVRLFQTQPIEFKNFNSAVTLCKNAFIKFSLVSSLNMGCLRFIILCMFVQGFWFGSDQVRKGNTTAGDVLTCFTSCLMLGESFRSMLPQIVTIQKANVAIKRLQYFIQIKSKKSGNYRDQHISQIRLYPPVCNGDIKFKNVDFSYPTRSQSKVLDNVTLHFPKGKLTFIVGKSGSGKSTLSNLLLNFYSSSKGRVEIDGFSVDDIDSNWLTDNITLVEQSCTLFNDTIKNNILMGSKHAIQHKEIEDAIQMSLLKEFIRDLPDGLDTLIGTNAIQLSGGQQQRIAIARARLRNTPILILDESVSALDIVLKDLIIEAIKKWRIGKTTIILTHQYNQIMADDFVYLMENGKVSEFGVRRDLEMKEDGVFQKLVSLQESVIPENDKNVYDVPEFNFDNYYEDFYLRTNEFLKKPKSRLSSQIISNIHSLSIFQDNHDINVSNELPFLKRTIKRKRQIQDIETRIETKIETKSEDERPELTPIKKIILRMFQTVEKKLILFIGITFCLLNGAVNPIFSYCFSKLLVVIVPAGSGSDVGQPDYLLRWSLIVIFLALFDGITTFLKDFLLDYSSELWVFNLRKKVFNTISRQSLSWFGLKNNNASEVNSLVLNDARDLRHLVSQFLSIITTVIILSNLGIIWALVKGWKLSLVCISLIPLFILTAGLYAGLLQSSENEYKNAIADLETQLYEITKGIKTIKTLKLYDHFTLKYNEKVVILQAISKRRAFLTGFGVAVTNALTFVVQGILLYYGMKLVGTQQYTVQQLMETFVLLLFSIMSCAQLMNSIPEVSRGQRAATYIFKILELEPSQTESKGSKIPPKYYNEDAIVAFNLVDFAYPSSPNQRVLKKVSFKIAKNDHVAIIGESGSGKSTIALLLTRLFEFKDDSVFFQNQDVNEVSISWLRNKIALVDQKASFFDGSIYDNLVYGLSNPNEKKVSKCLKLANIYDFVKSLPLELNTRIDTSLISGGQAQRLSIARSLLRDPELLILDECTSALDSESTHKIAKLIKDNLKDITVIMITHAEELMKISNKILAMKNGSLVEEGTFDQLLSQRGELYRIITAGIQ